MRSRSGLPSGCWCGTDDRRRSGMSTSEKRQQQSVVGQPLDRVDGRLKVTGRARYPAEVPLANLAHAVLVQSTIASGRIREMDTRPAEAAPGVHAVLTH